MSGPLVGAAGSSRDFQAALRRPGIRAGTPDRDFGAPLMVVIPFGRWRSLYGARPEPRLTMATPKEIPSGQQLCAHPGPAHQARLARPAVDVDLATVVVLARRTAHRLGRVLGPDGVDGAGADPLVHQHDQVLPDGPPLARAQRAARPERVHPVPEEHLGAVDVPAPGDALLVREQVAEGSRAGADPGPGPRGIGIGPQRVGPQPVDALGPPLRGHQLADD